MANADTDHATHAATLKTALDHHHAGRLVEAESLYRKVLDAAPDHPDALHLLGMVAFQTGKVPAAIELVLRALARNPAEPYYHHDYGDILRAQGHLDDAAARYREAIALKPDMVEAHANLAMLLHRIGRLDDAVASYDRALAITPKAPDLAYNAGNALKDLGRLDAAIARYRDALTLEPRFPPALYNLAVTLQMQGRIPDAIETYRRLVSIEPQYAAGHFNMATLLESRGQADEAIGSYHAAVALLPDLAEAHNNLANLLLTRGDVDAALAGYRQAIARKADYADAHLNLANLQHTLGHVDEAVAGFRRALATGETPAIKASFARCLGTLTFHRDDADLRRLMLRAITEPWTRPADLANATISLLRTRPGFADALERAAGAWPARMPEEILFGPDGLTTMAGDELFLALLTSTPVGDIALERFLTLARAVLWSDAADHASLTFLSALARQCQLNGYAFASTAEEDARASAARDRIAAAIAADGEIAPATVALAACYLPLDDVPGAPKLLDRAWPAPLADAMQALIAEPRDEQRLRDALPSLAAIEDSVSQRVRQQYEEHPYPRWTRVAPVAAAATFDVWLHATLPGVPFMPLGDDGAIDILVAGCGTGQHALETALRFPRARVVAMDLSRASLGYAARKAQETGVANLEFVHGDLLQIAAAGRAFDVIEAVGVLHHLADPAAGWRALQGVLRPGGFLLVGLYGERARAAIVAARALIAAQGYAATTADIRRLRQTAMAATDGSPLRAVAALRDFHSVNECRDMLFHVEEHRTTIPRIKALLAELGVAFVGFQVPPPVLLDYARRHPADRARTDLDRWHAFEIAVSQAFTGMYEFWVQKPR